MNERMRGFIQGLLVCFCLIGTIGIVKGYDRQVTAFFDDIDIIANDKEYHTDTLTFEDRLYVPIEDILKVLNGEYLWSNEKKEITEINSWSRYIQPKELAGNWNIVASLNNINDFDPSNLISTDHIMIQNLEFSDKDVIIRRKNGFELDYTWKDDVIILSDNTVSEFTIKEIDEVRYLFLEYKNGDYVAGKGTWYYVFKEVK